MPPADHNPTENSRQQHCRNERRNEDARNAHRRGIPSQTHLAEMSAMLETLAAKTPSAEWSALRYPKCGHKVERLAFLGLLFVPMLRQRGASVAGEQCDARTQAKRIRSSVGMDAPPTTVLSVAASCCEASGSSQCAGPLTSGHAAITTDVALRSSS